MLRRYVSYKQLKRLIKLSLEEASKVGTFDGDTNPAVMEFMRVIQSDLTHVAGLVSTRLNALESLLAEAQLSAILLGIFYTPSEVDRASTELLDSGPAPSPAVNGSMGAASSSGGKGRPNRDTVVGILSSASVASTSPAVSDLMAKMNKAIPALNDLMAYCEVNLAGFRKITKKYYKKTGDTGRQFPGFRNAILNQKLQQGYVACSRMREAIVLAYPNRPLSSLDSVGDEIRAALPLLSDTTLLKYLEISESQLRGLARSRSSSAGALSGLAYPQILQAQNIDVYAKPIPAAGKGGHQQQQPQVALQPSRKAPQGPGSYGGRRHNYGGGFRKGYGKGYGGGKGGGYNNRYQYARYAPPSYTNNLG